MKKTFISERGNAKLVIPRDTIVEFGEENSEYYRGFDAKIQINGRTHIYRFPYEMVVKDKKNFVPYVSGLILPDSATSINLPFGK